MTKDTNIDNLFEKDWTGFHDAVVEALGVQPSVTQAIALFKQIPEHLQEKAFKWGLNDTEVRDECFEAIHDLNLSIAHV